MSTEIENGPGYGHRQERRRSGKLTPRQTGALIRIFALPELEKEADDWSFADACNFWGLDTLSKRGPAVATWVESFRVLLEDVQTLTGSKPLACGDKELTWLMLSNLLALHAQLGDRFHKHLKLLSLREGLSTADLIEEERQKALQREPRSIYLNGCAQRRGEI